MSFLGCLDGSAKIKNHSKPLATEEDMSRRGCCGGKQIGVATILELKTLAQLGYCQWEIAYRDVGFVKTGQHGSQFLAVHGRLGNDAEAAAWEIRMIHGRGKEVGIGTYGTDAILTAQVRKASCLHDGSVWLEKIFWNDVVCRKEGNVGSQAVIGYGKHLRVIGTGKIERLLAVGDYYKEFLALVVNRYDVHLGG